MMLPLVRTCNKPHIPITCIIWRELAIKDRGGSLIPPSRLRLASSSAHHPYIPHLLIHSLSIVHLTHLHNFSCIHPLTNYSSIHPSIHTSILFCLVPNNVLMPNRFQFPQGSRSHKASTASLENILHAP